ncbi:PREDICTED: SMR domain-containing protein At5g58720 isoform X1 [Camelina sativa]|uniref:SMR domain-containing protein At5g58720 isoform X1 n=1 Tax=Camelina sativa TaxID=90675 RepID=A0ABM0XBG4_CAMSA|nr:PREDICTED: SMR domain-containing protein At5g58720 isoform X1 [Camelina sativa]
MKQKSQHKRKKKRSSAAKSSGDGGGGTASDGNKKDVEEERKDDGEGTKEIEKVEKKIIESLMEAFCSVSMEEATAAYKEAGGDLNKAADILSDLVDSSDDPSTSSSGQETASTSEYGAGSSSTCSEDLTRDRWFKGKKQSRVIAATGMVSSVIAKDYLKPNPVRKELPVVERSKELCGNGKKAADREKAEQFLNSMLGDDCELSMAVVRDVLCQCGYDVDMALNVLLDMSSSSTDDSLSAKSFGIGVSDSQLAETSFDTDTSESELFWGDYSRRDYAKVLSSSEDPFATSQGNDELGLPQKVLESLFNIRQSPKHEPKTMSWRNVAKKMQSLGIDASSSSGEEARPNTFVKDDGYHELRKGATDQWNVTKSYYQKAAEAYSKGGRAHAAYLSDKGRVASKLAQQADERASQDIFVARNKGIENVVTIDLHGQHVKQAMKLLKLHLLFGSYVPSIQTLRVITGCGSSGFGKSKVKQSVVKLLEREGVRYCEENRGTLLIKLDGCSREFSFLDTESDSE